MMMIMVIERMRESEKEQMIKIMMRKIARAEKFTATNEKKRKNKIKKKLLYHIYHQTQTVKQTFKIRHEILSTNSKTNENTQCKIEK